MELEGHLLRMIAFGVASWGIAFVFVRKSLPERSFGFCNRIVSTLHATLAVTLASLSVEDWSCPVCPLASKSSPRQMETLAFTLSYLIYDLICCLFDKRISVDNIIHHGVSIVGIGAGIAYQKMTFAVIFSFARMACGPYLTWVTLSADNPFIIKAMALGLQLVSAFWFYKIARMTKYKLIKRAAPSKVVNPRKLE
ncbi:hypothetical protein Tsubulata_035321 [Turnera subulata]|uniref:TLC domain-containing protein n=1 Tax=Turnera subulata TaxID=218843 RepID=A0A9Q0G180_9ROSI|nr:hypothetical protein Tsubulata_035321 [Turnera subulata]